MKHGPDEVEHVRARCDFCGRVELMVRWNQRTCVKCEAEGAPDQSKDGYDAKIKEWSVKQLSSRRNKGIKEI